MHISRARTTSAHSSWSVASIVYYSELLSRHKSATLNAENMTSTPRIYANIRFITNWKVTTLTKRRELEKWVHPSEPDGWKPICILTPWLCTHILPPVQRRALAADRLRSVDAAKHRHRQPKMPTGPIFVLFWFSNRVGRSKWLDYLYSCGLWRCYPVTCIVLKFIQTLEFMLWKLNNFSCDCL